MTPENYSTSSNPVSSASALVFPFISDSLSRSLDAAKGKLNFPRGETECSPDRWTSNGAAPREKLDVTGYGVGIIFPACAPLSQPNWYPLFVDGPANYPAPRTDVPKGSGIK